MIWKYMYVCGRIVVCVSIFIFSLCAFSFLILLIGVSRTCGRIICINHNTIHSVEYIDSAFGSLLFTEAKNGNKCQVDLFIWYTVDNVYALGNFNVQLYKQIELYIIGYYRLYFKQCIIIRDFKCRSCNDLILRY